MENSHLASIGLAPLMNRSNSYFPFGKFIILTFQLFFFPFKMFYILKYAIPAIIASHIQKQVMTPTY
ncbi:hypothetical protein ED203_17815 [Escherichia coli]|nr:hypothetical protein [Escherichia coli]